MALELRLVAIDKPADVNLILGQSHFYALDSVLPDLGAATKPQVEVAFKGHVIGQAERAVVERRALP